VTVIKNLIELDRYLDLDGLEPVNREFKETIGTISKKYWNIFYAETSGTEDLDSRNIDFTFDVEIPEDSGDMYTLYLREFADGHKKATDLDYLLIDKHESWVDLPIYEKFPKTKNLVSKLPFKNVARVMFCFQEKTGKSGIHVDHVDSNWRQEFIWFRLDISKKFYLLENNKPIYIQGSSGWFDTTIPHGSETEEYGVSLRVDGEFTPEFRKKLFGKDSKWETITSYEK
jgi:hypothetical protein